MSGIELAIYLDIIVLITCTALLLRYGRLSHSHPAAIYLFFHIYVFTSRLISVQFGSITLFSNWGSSFEPVTHDELARASIYADIAFLMITAACLKASRDVLKKEAKISLLSKSIKAATDSIPTLSLQHIRRVVIVALPIGIIGLVTLSYWPGGNPFRVNLGEWQNSSWVAITQTWMGLMLIALIYWYGFKLFLTVPMAFYLLVMSFQGYARFRVIIPIILLIQIYLERKGQRWPTLRLTLIILAVALLFFPLKSIGRMVQSGSSFTEISSTVTDAAGGALTGGADDQLFMDEFASALTLIDRGGKSYNGTTYLPLLSVAIPRQWWPDKPGLADFMRDFSTPWRPMFETGMITTFLGEAYANFGYLGIVFIPFLLAYFLARAYFRAYRSNYFSIARFTYLLVACNLIQVYRDGLLSIVVFTVVNMMPLMIIVLLHIIAPVKSPENRMPIGAGAERYSHTETPRTATAIKIQS